MKEAPALLSLPHCLLEHVLLECSGDGILALGCTCKGLLVACREPLLWRRLAVKKWGDRVPVEPPVAESDEGGENSTPSAGARAAPDWLAYCRQRSRAMPAPITPSPLDLAQEHYPEPWSHIAACIMCSRTTGGPAVRGAIAAVLAAYPTPSALLAAPRGEVRAALHPLGLQDNRLKALVDASEGFLGRAWSDPSEFYGCGKFTLDSWRIFCRGETSGVEDKNLKAYVAWLKRAQAQPQAQAQQGQQGQEQGHAIDTAQQGAAGHGHGQADADGVTRVAGRKRRGGQQATGGAGGGEGVGGPGASINARFTRSTRQRATTSSKDETSGAGAGAGAGAVACAPLSLSPAQAAPPPRTPPAAVKTKGKVAGKGALITKASSAPSCRSGAARGAAASKAAAAAASKAAAAAAASSRAKAVSGSGARAAARGHVDGASASARRRSVGGAVVAAR